MIKLLAAGPQRFIERIQKETRNSNLRLAFWTYHPEEAVEAIESNVIDCDALLLGFSRETSAAILEAVVKHGRNFVPFVSCSNPNAEEVQSWLSMQAVAVEQGKETETISEYFLAHPSAQHSGRASARRTGLSERLKGMEPGVSVLRKTAAFLSAYGGAGVSFLASYLAREAAGEGLTVSYLDFDFRCGMGKASFYLGADRIEYSLLSWQDTHKFNPTRSGVEYLPLASNPADFFLLKPKTVQTNICDIGQEFDLTVIDIGGSITPAAGTMLSLADHVFLVTDSYRQSIEATERFFFYFLDEFSRKKTVLLLNKNTKKANQLARSLDISKVFEFPLVNDLDTLIDRRKGLPEMPKEHPLTQETQGVLKYLFPGLKSRKEPAWKQLFPKIFRRRRRIF